MMLIEKLTKEKFNSGFKSKYLDGDVLSEESIAEIKKLFAIGDNETASLCCCEYHAHEFRCIFYNSPVSGVVERLILEIGHYQDILNKISRASKIG